MSYASSLMASRKPKLQPSFRARQVRPRRRFLRYSLLVLVMMLATVSAVSAQNSDSDSDSDLDEQDKNEIRSLRGEREQLARSAADTAEHIDALRADDESITGALAALEAYEELLQSRAAAAEASILAAEAEAMAAEQEARWLEEDINRIRGQLRDQAIEVFVQPRSDVVNQLANADFARSAVKLYLLDQVIGDGLEITDDLRSAEAQLEVARNKAVARADDAQREKEDQVVRLADLDEARAQAQRLKDEIQIRIEDWERTSEEIAAADRALTNDIASLEAAIQRREEERRLAQEEAERRAREEARQAAGPFELVIRPARGDINSKFGPRVHPIFGNVRQHNGVDIDGDTGDPIRAALSGEVILAEWRSAYGNTVVVYHGLGYSTLYAHLNSISVSVGDVVSSGDNLGEMGSTGWSTGPHLHFELRIDGKPVDPLPFLP